MYIISCESVKRVLPGYDRFDLLDEFVFVLQVYKSNDYNVNLLWRVFFPLSELNKVTKLSVVLNRVCML